MCTDPTFFDSTHAGINCRDGFIQFDHSGQPTLEPHDRDHRCRHILTRSWQPGAPGAPPPASLLDRLLHGVFQGDSDEQAKIDLIAEICGSAALGYGTKLREPKAIILLGTPPLSLDAFTKRVKGNAPPGITYSRKSSGRYFFGMVLPQEAAKPGPYLVQGLAAK